MKGDALERYIRQATRGLYGEKRARVVRELRGNLEGRINEFLAFGDSRERAVERALLEFGAAGVVSRGMREVHVMPILNKWTVAAGMLGIMAFLSLSATASGVKFTLDAPVPVCEHTSVGTLKANPCAIRGTSWLELDSLLEVLKSQGVRVEREAKTGLATQVQLFFPGQTNPVVVKTLNEESAQYPASFELTRFQRSDKLYISTSQFLQALETFPLTLTVSSLKNPKLNIAGVKLELGDRANLVNIQVALERWVIGRALFSPAYSPKANSGTLESPQAGGPFSPFRVFFPVSGDVRDTQVQPRPITLKLSKNSEHFYLLMTKIATLEKGKIVPTLGLELLERQPNNTLISRSYLLNGKFVRDINALYNDDDQGTGLLWAINLEKPDNLLDTKNPIVLRSSDISY